MSLSKVFLDQKRFRKTQLCSAFDHIDLHFRKNQTISGQPVQWPRISAVKQLHSMTWPPPCFTGDTPSFLHPYFSGGETAQSMSPQAIKHFTDGICSHEQLLLNRLFFVDQYPLSL